ncbi:hypothetical protein BS50DRAFT_382551 [Corynespora cassiicola Philippines]|uniref:Uncharacterized protein n=1 Tax=Corynespora cassiicola Philippines TaxID=1448308 RepID=A0A2T2NNU8_CORCC|nr:hypothetical protein BS50DRAFT_382551 [Corynespora cassiicola Philippines]
MPRRGVSTSSGILFPAQVCLTVQVYRWVSCIVRRIDTSRSSHPHLHHVKHYTSTEKKYSLRIVEKGSAPTQSLQIRGFSPILPRHLTAWKAEEARFESTPHM